MKIFLVGGAVRDQLLHLPIIDKDWVVVGASPQQMLELGYVPVGKDFPVFLHPFTKEEYALARTERKTGRGYSQFIFNTSPLVTLEEDLRRRDITINAIAKTEDGGLIDPFQGISDLNNRLIRHVSDAFIEDPVRVLRVARFAARFKKFDFKVAPETITLMEKMVENGEVSHLVPERVWLELKKALAEEHPSQFFYILRECKANKVIFPEIDALFGVPNPEKWHPEIDSGIHTMMVLDAAAKLSSSIAIRFAALVHDLGKALTPEKYWPKHHNHEQTGAEVVKQFCDRLRVPKEIKDLALLVTRHHGTCHRIFEVKASTLIRFLEKLDAFRRPERFEAFLLACEADHRGRTGYEDKDYPQRAFLLTAFEKANAIKVKDLLLQGYSGTQLANAIHKARIGAVNELIAK